jgi:ubiquinone/menaquinone biosynthesis C-methylase UbiE
MTNDFDVAASNYDDTFTFSKIGKAQRHVVYKNLEAVFKSKKPLNLLELNCGTGHDAEQFAKKGHHVLATDLSEEMIAVCKQKHPRINLDFRTLDIDQLDAQPFNHKFDVIFSNFGGLNCLSPDQLQQFFKNASKLLSKKGKLIIVVMPKECVWERIYFSLKNDYKKARRRHTSSFVLANVDGVAVKTWYYNPKDIIHLAHSQFTVNHLKPIGLTIPPSYLEKSILGSKFAIVIFSFFDAIFTSKRLAKYADHFLIELELK